MQDVGPESLPARIEQHLFACQPRAVTAFAVAMPLRTAPDKLASPKAAATRGLQFDDNCNILAGVWCPGGNCGPLHKPAILIGKRQFTRAAP